MDERQNRGLKEKEMGSVGRGERLARRDYNQTSLSL